MLHTPIFIRGQNKSQSSVNLKYSSRSIVKPLYLCEVRGKIGQDQSKILAQSSDPCNAEIKKIWSRFCPWMKIGVHCIRECHPLSGRSRLLEREVPP